MKLGIENMDFVTAVASCLNKYFDFAGRASRAEYGLFLFSCVVVGATFLMFDIAVFNLFDFYLPTTAVYVGLVIIPVATATVRRLHDVNRSAAWLILNTVPVYGQLTLMVMCMMPSAKAANIYGKAYKDRFADISLQGTRPEGRALALKAAIDGEARRKMQERYRNRAAASTSA